MSVQKQKSKTTNKRTIVSFSNNPAIIDRLSRLTKKYNGLSTTEIIKLAIIELDEKVNYETELMTKSEFKNFLDTEFPEDNSTQFDYKATYNKVKKLITK